MSMDAVESHEPSQHILARELNALADKIAELEMEADEFRVVIAALRPLDPSRKCFRKISGVLVESEIQHVLPVLEKTLQGVEAALISMKKSWQVKHDDANFPKSH